jgi:hypothetical protein
LDVFWRQRLALVDCCLHEIFGRSFIMDANAPAAAGRYKLRIALKSGKERGMCVFQPVRRRW